MKNLLSRLFKYIDCKMMQFELRVRQKQRPKMPIDVSGTGESITGLKEEDFVHNTLIDEDGYHCDSKTQDFKDNGNGCYSLTIKNLGRSDKTTTLYDFKSATKQQCDDKADELRNIWLKANPYKSIKDHNDMIKKGKEFLQNIEDNNHD